MVWNHEVGPKIIDDARKRRVLVLPQKWDRVGFKRVDNDFLKEKTTNKVADDSLQCGFESLEHVESLDLGWSNVLYHVSGQPHGRRLRDSSVGDRPNDLLECGFAEDSPDVLEDRK